MDGLSERLGALYNGLCEIPEFSDERLKDALVEFQEWLHYRAECIESHQVQPATTRQYASQVMKEMTQYVAKVEAALSDFIKEGVGAIRDAQEMSQTRLQNMSTVFSMDQDRLKTPAMGLWIASLILSIASAINSQIAIHWRAAMYRSPRSALPIWTPFLFDHAPLGCLVLAVLAFSVGLVVWTFAAGFHISVSISTVVITCATFLVLFTIIFWECREWCRDKHAEPTPVDLKTIISMQEPHHQQRAAEIAEGSAIEEGGPASAGTWMTVTAGLYQLLQPLPDGLRNNLGDQALHLKRALTPDLPDTGEDDEIQDEEVPTVLHSAKSAPLQTGEISPPPSMFQKAVLDLICDENLRKLVSDRLPDVRRRQDKLQTLRPIHRLRIFHPSGHDIHFSPDGKRLAVSQLDGSVAIWAVDKLDGEAERTLLSSVGRFAWSPDSSHIVIIAKEGLSIRKANKLEEPGSFAKTGTVRVMAWLQSSSGFFAVIGDELQIYMSGA
ncbi:hypothetical protein FRC05_007685 [Tulasnella sp. 425]|nr:hypothetical protein FRC05_007685 [Tulasnella sp. 425]